MVSKPLRTLVAFLVLGAAAAFQALGQSAYVVTITDLRKNVSYEVMTREQVSALSKRAEHARDARFEIGGAPVVADL